MVKKLICGLLALLLCWIAVCPAFAQTLPEELDLYAQAAVLMDADTGQVLYGKNENRAMQPASLTKIMTCLLAMERGDTDDLVTMTAEGLRLMKGSSTAGLVEGETLTLEQMLYALMLPSANDAANAIAIHLAGSTEAFAQLMNEKAEQLGLKNTNFENAHGLPQRGHTTTAYDLAQITRAALQYPAFLQYAGSESYQIAQSEHNQAHQFTHTNRILRTDSTFYSEEAIAGKTGWTMMAGNCLMTVEERDGVTLIAVVLKSDSDAVANAAYLDTQALFEYGFENFEQTQITIESIEPYTLTFWDEQDVEQQALIWGDSMQQSILLPKGYTLQDIVVQQIQAQDLQSSEDVESLSAQILLNSGEEDAWPWPVAQMDLHVEVTPVQQAQQTGQQVDQQTTEDAIEPFQTVFIVILCLLMVAGFLLWLHVFLRRQP